MPSIDSLRSALGPLAEGKSDEQLLRMASDATGQSAASLAGMFGYDPSSSGMTGQRFGSSIDRYQAGLYGFGEAATRAVGLNSAANFLQRQRESNEYQADVAAQRASAQGAIDRFADVNSLSDFGNYAAGLGIQSAPYLGEALVGGIAARGLMSGTRAALGAANAAGDTAAAARASSQLRTGSTVGAVTASYPSAVGDILGSQRDQANTVDTAAAFALGIPYAALNAFGLEGALARRSAMRSGIEALDNISGFKGGVARAAATGARTGVGEAINETGQEAVNQLGRMAVDPNETFLNPKSLERFGESAIGGLTLGGLIGAGAGGWRRSKTVDNGQFDLTGQGNPPADPVPPAPPAQLSYSPLAGTPTIFPDGTVALNGEQELQARYGGVANTQQSAPAPAPAEQIAAEAIARAAERLGVAQSPNLPSAFDVLGGRVYGQEQLNKTLAEWATAQQQKTPGQQELTDRVLDSGLVSFSPDKVLTAKKIESTVNSTLRQFQLTEAQNPAQAASILNDQIANMVAAGKNEGDVRLGKAATLYEALTGEQPPGLSGKAPGQNVVKTQQTGAANVSPSVPAGRALAGSVGGGSPVVSGRVADTGPANPQPVGVGGNAAGAGAPATATGVLPVTGGKQPAPVAPSATPVAPSATQDNGQLDDGYTSDAEAWEDFAPQGSMRYEDLAAGYRSMWSEARRRRKMTGELAESIAYEAQEDNDTTDATDSVRGVLREVFGEKNADILAAVLLGNTTHEDAANANGDSRANVSRLAGGGTTGANERSKAIDRAAKRLGWSPEYATALKEQLNDLAEQAGKAMTAADIDARTTSMDEVADESYGAGGTISETLTSDDTAFGARGTLNTENQTFAEAGLSTISSAGASTGYTGNSTKKDEELTPRRLADKLTELWSKVAAQIEYLQRTSAASKTGSVATGNKKLSRDEVEAKIAKLQQKADGLLARIEDALAKASPTLDPAGDADTDVDAETTADVLDELEVERPKSRGRVGDDSDPAAGDYLADNTSDAGAPKKSKEKKSAAPKTAPVEPRVDSGQKLWEELREQMPQLRPYEDLNDNERGYLTELADRTNGKPVLAKEMGLQLMVEQDLGRQDTAMQDAVQEAVQALPAAQVAQLENAYGAKNGTQQFLDRVVQDVVNFTNKAVQKVDAAIRGIIKGIAEGVLAVGVILNPAAFKQDFSFNLPATYERTVQVGEREVRAQVPVNAAAKMSATAKAVYETMAPVAQKSGKGFMIADKQAGMIHAFNADGSLMVQDSALYGKDMGDKLGKSSLQGGPKITPSGKYTLGLAESSDYTGGYTFRLLESEDETGFVAIHAVYVGDPRENRVKRLKNNSAADKRASYGCINTTNETFLNKLLPNADKLDGGMIFVLPDSPMRLGEFAATTEPVLGKTPEQTSGVGTEQRDTQQGLPKQEKRGQQRSGRAMRRAQTQDKDGNTVDLKEESLERLERFPGIARAISAYRNGPLANALDSVTSWFVAGGGPGWDGAFTVVDSQPVVVLNAASLVNEPVIEWTVHHEMGHAVDAVHAGGGTYSGMPEFNVRVVNNRIVPMGAVMNRVFRHYQSEPDSELSQHLVYPFDRTQNADLNAEAVREEVFAQLWATYNTRTGREFLEDNLPDVATFMEDVYEDVKQTNFTAATANGGAQKSQAGAAGQGGQAAQRGQVQGAAALREGRSQVSWADRDEPSGWIRNQALRSWANKLSDLYDETTNPDAAFQAAVEAANPREAAVLRALRKDDLLGFDYPHQALSAVMQEPGSFELSTPLKGALTRLANSTPLASTFRENRTQARPTKGLIQRNIAKLPKQAQQPVRNILGTLGDVAGKGLDYVVFTSDLVKRAADAGLTAATKFERLIAQSKSEAREMEREVERVADLYALVPDKDRGTGEGSVNRFLFDSTREGKWGFKADWRKTPVQVDPAMAKRFNALDAKSQAFVKAVFKHGDDVLATKKKTVLDAAETEYDTFIKAAKDSGDTDAEAKLTAEKAATLKRFQSLFKIREGIPYAPIKRDGNYVVIAKSAEYQQAEAANDQKKLRELESDGDHYHVSFVDSKWDARTMQAQLQEQGFFQDVQFAERDQATDELYGGESSLRQLSAIRAKVDRQVAAQTVDGKPDPTGQRLLKIISQMYLEALAEGSARKSEMRRRGVDGEVDMLQSFTRQGRADANFLSSVKYHPKVQDALQDMRKQAKTGDRTRKSELLNELARRYTQSLDYQPRPWVDKLTRLSSIYFLVTSPAYYIQNLTQPWMMSVPAMAGRHDYTTASAALFKAYGELKDVMASTKLFSQQLDFDKVPADVRAAIKELANRGKIDIGLDTELGEFSIGGDGAVRDRANRIDKGMRMAVQKVESLNRLSTAMAAYRLELKRSNGNTAAALDYADRILTETHGDYTAFNAPRAFNTSVGKVALQFRKFQLIQLAFYAKLIKDAYQGRDRKAALKTLAFSLGHTGLLAGAMGMPGYAAIAWALGALFGDDDEKYDLTNEIRKAIGDEAMANLILRGAPTLAGADLSGKVGSGNMLSILPFSNADLTTRSGLYEAAGTLIGGAAGGMTVRMLDGLGLMMSGDFYKGLELVIPKGPADAMKAYRIANEGMTRRNGDVLLPPDQVSSMGAIFQALGVPSVQQQVVYERQQRVKDMDQTFQERSTRIKNDYVKANREGDADAKAEARDAWNKLQEARVRNGYTKQPLSILLKAPQEQAKREKNTAGGVQFNKANRRAVEEQADI